MLDSIILNLFQSLVEGWVVSKPMLVEALKLCMMIRLAAKPIFAAFANYVKGTASLDDDALLAKFLGICDAMKADPVGGKLLWILDLFFSIKFPAMPAKVELEVK